ncbi:hypothetical protein, partial [Nevskia sp.]|uniref:hypothetical protein n=1 Tax=Nevskia sp. TaxID=1929292 RepID=UPI0025E7BB1D
QPWSGSTDARRARSALSRTEGTRSGLIAKADHQVTNGGSRQAVSIPVRTADCDISVTDQGFMTVSRTARKSLNSHL